jgi:hypothetical protein
MLTAQGYRNRFNGVQNGTHFSVFDVEEENRELGDNTTILVMGLVQDDMTWNGDQ